jgi:acylphosphatase
LSSPEPAVSRHVVVSGRVQGVGFRWSARHRARELGVAGWARNLADGRVEAVLEGEEGSVSAMLDWLAEGPPGARVTDLQVVECPAEGHEGFEIRR